MATTAQGLFSTIDDSAFMWKSSSSVTGTHGAFLTAIKGTATEDDTIKLENLKYIVLELGVDSGISGKPITIQNVKLNFDERTSTDEQFNNITAMAKIGPMPSTLYYRVIAFADSSKEYKSGSLPVSINIVKF